MLLTITTSKRPELFKRTMESIEKKLNEFYLMDGLISGVTVYDDNSTPEQLDQMRGMFPWVKRWSLAGEGEAGHAASLNRIWKDVTESGEKFFVHWEDDWELQRPASLILAALDVMANNKFTGQVCFGRPDIRILNHINRTATGTDYIRRHGHFEDSYPSFTLNPCVFRVEALRMTGPFEEAEGMEKQYGERWISGGWLTVDLFPDNLRHIGDGNSAYDLNGRTR